LDEKLSEINDYFSVKLLFRAYTLVCKMRKNKMETSEMMEASVEASQGSERKGIF
jgi:hypothetical protein